MPLPPLLMRPLQRLRLHPSELLLERYAERALDGTRASWVRRHLASCVECRASVSFTRSLRDALTSLPEIGAPDDALLARIVAERRAGMRIVLPTASSEAARHVRRRRHVVRVVGAAAAAILVAAVMARSWRPSAPDARTAALRGGASPPPSAAEAFAVSEFFLPRSAYGAEPTRDAAAWPPLSIDGTRLRPGRVSYARFENTPGGARRQIGAESVELFPAQIDGRDVWRIVQRRQIADTEHVETLYADRATLRPLGRTIRVQPYMHYAGITVRQRMVGDTLIGWMNTDSGLGRPIARHLAQRSGPYFSDALSPVLLGATTLGPAWHGSLSVLGWAVRDGDVSFPVQLRVTGDERITVPAGTFDCWRLAVDASVGMQTYWVRKSDGVGVRAVLERDGVVRDLVLVK